MYCRPPRIRFLICFSALTISACGLPGSGPAPESTSAASAELRDIATDLPDTGLASDVHLYWVSSGRIFRAACDDTGILTRIHCRTELASMPYTAFKEQLDGGLSDLILQLTEESARIQLAMSRVREEISRVQSAIDRLNAQGGPLRDQLQLLEREMKTFDSWIVDLGEQIRLINDRLARLANGDLARQRDKILQQIDNLRSEMNGIETRMLAVSNSLQRIAGQIAPLAAELTALRTRLDNLNVEAAQVAVRLDLARSDFAVYRETLDYLTDGIVFHVLRDNTWYAAVRQFVKRFDRIFAAN